MLLALFEVRMVQNNLCAFYLYPYLNGVVNNDIYLGIVQVFQELS